MNSDVQVALIGATGAVGTEILTVLDKAPWRPSKVVPFARPSTKTPFVEYGEEQLPVEDLNFANLSDFNVILVATPAAAASEIVQEVVKHGVVVVDVSGVSSLQGDVPLVIPWVNPEGLEKVGPRGVVSVPGASATIAASVAGPIARSGLLESISGTVLIPASAWGRQGVDELSSQVVALFNSGTPPRKVFTRGLAFDVLSEVDQRLESGSTLSELMAETQFKAVLPTEYPCSLSLIGVPVFSGISAELTLQLRDASTAETIARILADGGVAVGDGSSMAGINSPRRVEGEAFVHVSRIRVDGNVVRVWAVMDNLRAAATIAVANAGALIRRE